jgi:hypothetical protein
MVDEAKVLIAASGMKILPISDLEVTPAPFFCLILQVQLKGLSHEAIKPQKG